MSKVIKMFYELKDRILQAFGDLELVWNITQNEWESFIFKNKDKNGK